MTHQHDSRTSFREGELDRPAEIPKDLFSIAVDIARELPGRVQQTNREFAALVIARALAGERERCATLVETKAVSRGYAGGMPRGELTKRTNPSAAAQLLAAAIRAGE